MSSQHDARACTPPKPTHLRSPRPPRARCRLPRLPPCRRPAAHAKLSYTDHDDCTKSLLSLGQSKRRLLARHRGPPGGGSVAGGRRTCCAAGGRRTRCGCVPPKTTARAPADGVCKPKAAHGSAAFRIVTLGQEGAARSTRGAASATIWAWSTAQPLRTLNLLRAGRRPAQKSGVRIGDRRQRPLSGPKAAAIATHADSSASTSGLGEHLRQARTLRARWSPQSGVPCLRPRRW